MWSKREAMLPRCACQKRTSERQFVWFRSSREAICFGAGSQKPDNSKEELEMAGEKVNKLTDKE